MNSSIRTLRRASLVGIALLILSGCSRSLPTAPMLNEQATTGRGTAVGPELAPTPGSQPVPDTAPPPPSRLSAGTLLGGVSVPRPGPEILNWDLVIEQIVLPLETTRVTGNRYELLFQPKSVELPELVSIKQYDPDVVDVTFGPHGLKFGEPVTLSIDFSGTQADPKSEKWDGSDPVLWWLNEDTMRWEEVPGSTDWTRLRHVVRLEHFSRYVLGGKAGWKQQPSREQD